MKKHINKQEAILLDKAWQWVNDEFPFSGYIPATRKGSYYEMPKAVLKYLDRGSSILDFGAGSCDKTAMLSQVGFQVTAFDDLGDNWHNFNDNREKILSYAVKAGIEYLLPDENDNIEFPTKHYDAIILNNTVEHLHNSPRMLLNKLLESLKTGGFIFIDVPNAANLRKRIDLLRGRTNYPLFDSFYWSSYPWRGHVREFVKDDLIKLAQFLGMEIINISSHHYHLDAVSPLIRKTFILVCKFMPSLRESWMLVGKKPAGWQQRNVPTESEAAVAFNKQYFKCNKTDIDWETS